MQLFLQSHAVQAGANEVQGLFDTLGDIVLVADRIVVAEVLDALKVDVEVVLSALDIVMHSDPSHRTCFI